MELLIPVSKLMTQHSRHSHPIIVELLGRHAKRHLHRSGGRDIYRSLTKKPRDTAVYIKSDGAAKAK